MRRVLLIVALAGVLLLAGCADGVLDGEMIREDAESLDDAPSGEAIENEDERGADAIAPDGELEIHHIDVGQADSTLIITPDGETILIDTGDWRQDGGIVIDYLTAHDVDRIDHLIATHGHADHIGGHASIIETFETDRGGIGAIYDSGVPHTSRTYENYLDAVERHDHELLIVEEGDELPIDDPTLSATVLNPPTGDSGSDLHYNSVSIVFAFGDVRYLMTGDAEAAAEARMIDAWAAELDVDIYQAGHHGSSTSSTPAFMDIVSPEAAIISSNFDSQYGHPHDEILESFADRNIETYWTGVHSDIVLTSDGATFEIEPTEEFSNDPASLLEAKHGTGADNYAIAPPAGVTG